LYSSPKAGLNAVPTVKITLGTLFPGVPAGNDPCFYLDSPNEMVAERERERRKQRKLN